MKKGFTLVELLAVIVILSIIGLISVPIITSNIEKSRKSAYRSSVQNAIAAAKEYVSKNMEDNDFPEGGISVTTIKYKTGDFRSGIIKRNEDKEIIASNVYNGEYCANGTKNNLIVEKVDSVEECESIDYTSPELKVKVVKVTNTSIMVNAYGYEESSEIVGYSFKIGDSDKKEIKTNKKVASYTFDNLQAGTTYEIEVEVKNENAEKNDSQYTEETYLTKKTIEVRTTEEGVPIFKVSSNSYAKSKEITITYPEIENGENSYLIREFSENAKEVETKVEGNKTSIEVTKNVHITARISYGSGYVENSINIVGIDDKGPEIVNIDNPDNWEKKKVLTITVKDTGAGLASRPYSFDDGKTWIKANDKNKPNVISKVYTENQEVSFLVRDKMGNASSVEEKLDGKKILISKVDTVKPECSLKVVSGTLGTNGWYKDGSIKDVTIGFDTLTDTAIDEKGQVVKTTGIVKTEISNTSSVSSKQTAENKEKQTSTIAKVSGITTLLTQDGIYKAEALVYDEAGNTNTCELEVKRDVKHPVTSVAIVGTKINGNSLNAIDKAILKGQDTYTLNSYIKTTCSDEKSGVSYTSPNQPFTQPSTESLTKYSKTGKCIDKAGNESTKESDKYLIIQNIRTYKCGYDSCRTAACGVESYNVCSDPACGSYGYACNPYTCGCTTCWQQIPYDCSYRQAYSCYKGQSCTQYRDVCCDGNGVAVNCHTCFVRSCSPQYGTCYRTVSQTCYTSSAYTCGCTTCYQTCTAYYSCATAACGVASWKICVNSACGWASCWQL